MPCQKSSSHQTQRPAWVIHFEPGSYLEVIPWEELRPVTAPDNLPTQFPFDTFATSGIDELQDSRWAVWEGVGAGDEELLRHHIVTEDEVYQHHLIEAPCSDGYLRDGKVVFTLTPLEESTLLLDINNFWSFWVSYYYGS
jgi:hypothetical protein